MKALVTGANGHIGSQVVRACINSGMEPVACVRESSDLRGLAGLDLETRHADLLDKAAIARAMKGVELVFHVAAAHRNFAVDTNDIIAPAVDGTRNVLSAARNAGVSRVVYCSSGATVGFTDDPSVALNESHFLEKAASPYVRGKIEAEKLALKVAEEGDLDVVIVNPSGVFGPLDYRVTPASSALVGLLQGDPAFMAVCVTDVRDVAQGHILAAQKGKSGQRYLLAGSPLQPKALSDTFAELSSIRPKVMRPPRFLVRILAGFAERKVAKKGGDAPITKALLEDAWGRHLVYDSSLAKDELAWKVRSPTEALRDAFRWLLFIGALKPKVAKRVRQALGESADPDEAWVMP